MTSCHWSDDRDCGRRRSQASGFLVATGLAAAIACVLVATARPRLDDGSGALREKINPNTATVASLARLPGIGWTRARAIVIYRERVVNEMPGAVPFKSLEDLQCIRGIGPRTVQGLASWLEFD